MADFHEVRFPTAISRGSSGGPRRRTDIVTLRSGYEERNAVWADSRREYDAGLGVQDLSGLYEVLEFFEARLGRLYSFRWKDWSDYRSVGPNSEISGQDQKVKAFLGKTGVFSLAKTYSSGPTEYTRTIQKVVTGTVIVESNGSALTEGVDYILDYNTGLLYFGAEVNIETTTAGFEFDVPVRFSNDQIDVNVELFNVGSIPQIGVIEVKTPQKVNEELSYQIWALWLEGVDIDTAVNVNWTLTWGAL